jgi:hypothetical protein
MQLTIDIKDSALDKIMYLLSHLQSDVRIVSKSDDSALDIEALSIEDPDYQYILTCREERKKHPENYGSLNDVDWN